MAKGWKGVERRDLNELGYDARRPYKFSCPDPLCFWTVACKDEESAINEQKTHPHPWWGGQTKVSWSVGKSLVEQMWEKLDIEYSVLYADGFQDPMRKGRARAIAECLVLFMQPHFTDPDEVIREAGRRHKADLEGDDEYVTKGMGSRSYELPPPLRDLAPPRTRKITSAPPRTPDTSKVDEQTKKAIRAALASGMFTEQELAKAYGLTVAVVSAIKGTI